MIKKKLLLPTLILFFITGFTACKKDDFESKPLSAKMIGKWQVNKIDVTTGTSTVSTAYAASDYIEFKDSKDDDELLDYKFFICGIQYSCGRSLS